jgi:outer membrane receptor protein involved in Fe transport
VEVDAELSPFTELKLSASYLLVDARVTEFPGTESLVGNRLPQVPKQQLNLQLRYRPASRWTLSVQTRMSSDRFEDDTNTLLLDGYFTADAMAAFRANGNIEVFAAAENIFNSRYDIGLTPNRTVAAPAFVRVGLRFDFSKR